jgi:superfamily II DNA or RNA helicase
VHDTVPGARTRILESITQVEALRHEAGSGPLFVMLSREKAKLSHAWRPAYLERKQFLRDHQGRLRAFTIPACPKCGMVLETDEGLLTHDELARKRRACTCGERLWQADPKGPRRFALAHYIARKLKGFFELLVLDEMHELKARGSAQGIAAAALAEAIPRTLGLTGTLFGGYSSNLFYLLYRFSPRLREHYGFADEARFVQHYGVLERITREGDEDDGRVSRRKGRSSITRERPGLSPAVLPHLLFNTVFLRLSDVAAALPPYHEEIEILRMEEKQHAVHSAFKAELMAEVQAQLAMGSKKLLGAYLQSLLHHPDTPWREETVTSVDANGRAYTVAHAGALDDAVIYPKERRLIDIARQEKHKGRRVLVFVQGTERRDITARLETLLIREGFKAAVLKSHTVEAKKREAWVAQEVRKGLDVLICHPRIVQTGLDLLSFPTLVFYQTEYSVYTLRQASRRSWRIGQTQPVKVLHLAYQETLQTKALALIAKKAQASLALEGELGEGGLVSMADDDLMVSLAKSLIEGEEESIASLSSAFGEEDEFVIDMPAGPAEAILDPADALGLLIPDPPVLEEPSVSATVKRVAFTDAPLELGKGRRKQVVPAGTGMLFPELMESS